jgi:hypothetical protein
VKLFVGSRGGCQRLLAIFGSWSGTFWVGAVLASMSLLMSGRLRA